MTAPPRIFDRSLLAARRRRALARQAPGADFLFARAAEDLAERLSAVARQFDIAVDLGSPTPALSGLVRATGKVGSVIRLGRIISEGDAPSIVADEEALPLRPGSVDLVVSALALQEVNDLPGVLAQVRAALKPDGLFLASLLGGETLAELRTSLAEAEAEATGGASPRIAPFAEVRALGALLQRAGFALPVADQDRVTVRYGDALGLMRDLRAMGSANSLVERSRTPLARRILFRAVEIYAERFADPDGRVRATFDIVSLSGWAPHPDQQKPLKPGSARSRLAEALGVDERPLRGR